MRPRVPTLNQSNCNVRYNYIIMISLYLSLPVSLPLSPLSPACLSYLSATTTSTSLVISVARYGRLCQHLRTTKQEWTTIHRGTIVWTAHLQDTVHWILKHNASSTIGLMTSLTFVVLYNTTVKHIRNRVLASTTYKYIDRQFLVSNFLLLQFVTLRWLSCWLNNLLLFVWVLPQTSQCFRLVCFRAWLVCCSLARSSQILDVLVYLWVESLLWRQLYRGSRIEQCWQNGSLPHRVGASVGPRARQTRCSDTVLVASGRKYRWGHQKACRLHTVRLSRLAWNSCLHLKQPYS